MQNVKRFKEEKLMAQLLTMCKPTCEKIEQHRAETCKPNILPQYSEAAACNRQEDRDFDQDIIIEQAVYQWAHLALKHLQSGEDIKISEFLGLYVEITEEVQNDNRELPLMRLSLLETVQLYNAQALTFPIACKILIAGLQITVDNISTRNFYGKSENLRSLDKLLHAISSGAVPYKNALINFID